MSWLRKLQVRLFGYPVAAIDSPSGPEPQRWPFYGQGLSWGGPGKGWQAAQMSNSVDQWRGMLVGKRKNLIECRRRHEKYIVEIDATLRQIDEVAEYYELENVK